MESGNELNAVMLTSGASGRVNALLSARAWSYLLTLVNAVLLIFLFPFTGGRRPVVTAPVSPEKNGKEERSGKGLAAVRVPTTIVPWKSGSMEVVGRRAIAIRRVTQEGNVDGQTLRDYAMFVTSRGDNLFTQMWTPLSNKLRSYIISFEDLLVYMVCVYSFETSWCYHIVKFEDESLICLLIWKTYCLIGHCIEYRHIPWSSS